MEKWRPSKSMSQVELYRVITTKYLFPSGNEGKT
tara:strand:+ start:1487 stop:1588 length:102 start_codon:yes stop_codon:yes gene_type:complete